jgi:oxalate decarboxylase/phosphoglucose isomerase-like protein (cupin superfamily)
LQGQGEVTLEDSIMHCLVQNIKANNVVIISKNYPQSIKNTGNQDLIFLVICTPRLNADNYSD